MSAFSALSPLVRGLFKLWMLTVCHAAVICTVYTIHQRQFRRTARAVPCLAAAYFMWQIMMDISEQHLGRHANAFSLRCAETPWIICAAAVLLLSLYLAHIMFCSVGYSRRNISTGSIKLCADSLPCGICYWRDGGRVIFANECMTELCFLLLGCALQNGDELFAAVAEPVMPVGDRVWSFTSRTFDFRGAPLHELVAADVTELYSKTASLKAENEEIARYNESLRTYNLNIDETVRRKEILHAKASIHDEMNRLMLATVSAGDEGSDSVDRALAMWQSNALLLCREASYSENDGSAAELERIAAALKIRLVWRSSIPDTLQKKQRALFFSAAQEAMANAFKHAAAGTMEIGFSEVDGGWLCELSNDGSLPDGAVSFTGGLANLSSLAKAQGADVSVTISDCFTLSLFLPQESKNPPFGRREFGF